MVELDSQGIILEEYLALPETNRIVELIDGQLVETPLPFDIHQKTLGQLLFFLIQQELKGVLRHAATGVCLDELNFFEPDLLWMSPHNFGCILIEGRYWYGAPDLIIEILSPSTAYRDRGIKYEIYEKHGVREYWLVDPEAAFIEVYTLADGRFLRLGLFRAGQTFASPVLNSEIQVATLLG